MGAVEQKRFYWFLLVPVLLFLGVFLVLPLVLLLFLSFRDVDAMMNTLETYSFSQYVEVFSSDIYLKTIGITLWTALKTTVLCLVMAYPAAYLLVKAPTGRLRALFYILLVSPLLTSVVIRTFSWIVLLSQNGIVNEMLISMKVIEKPLPLLWNMNAVIIAYVQVMLPFAVLPLAGSLSEMKPDLKFASMSLGAGRLRTFFFRDLADDGSGIADRSNDRVFTFCRKLYYASSRRGKDAAAPAVVNLSAGHASLSSSSCSRYGNYFISRCQRGYRNPWFFPKALGGENKWVGDSAVCLGENGLMCVFGLRVYWYTFFWRCLSL
nr:ABC transporter permease [Bacillus haynesii]